MQDEARQNFTAEDLSLVTDDGGDESGDKATIAGGADAKTEAGGKSQEKPQAKASAQDDGDKVKPKSGTIASGRDSEEDDAADGPDKPYWPDDWREKMARHRAGSDDKAYKKELKRLQNFASPEGVYGMGREAESKLTSGQLLKRPGKDAKPEEVKEFYQQLGAPEKADDYYANLQLDNGAVVGEADKPFLEDLAKTVHGSNAPVTPEQFKVFTNWYYRQQETQAAQMDDEDDQHRITSERALKEEFGPSFKRRINALPMLFEQAPGGTDINNEGGVYARLMGGRTSDGRLIGNDPDVLKWLDSLRADSRPFATLTEDGQGNAQSAQNRLDEIQKLRQTEPRKYWSDEVQAEELKLINSLQKDRARQRA